MKEQLLELLARYGNDVFHKLPHYKTAKMGGDHGVWVGLESYDPKTLTFKVRDVDGDTLANISKMNKGLQDRDGVQVGIAVGEATEPVRKGVLVIPKKLDTRDKLVRDLTPHEAGDLLAQHRLTSHLPRLPSFNSGLPTRSTLHNTTPQRTTPRCPQRGATTAGTLPNANTTKW